MLNYENFKNFTGNTRNARTVEWCAPCQEDNKK